MNLNLNCENLFVFGAKVLLLFHISKFYARKILRIVFFVVPLQQKFETMMTTEEMQNQLRTIVNKAARSLTDEDKTFLLWAGEKFNLQRGGKSGCVKCWHDYAMQIAIKLKEQAQPEAEDTRKYILNKGVDVYFGNIRVNEATLTDELAERILARGFERKFFAKC